MNDSNQEGKIDFATLKAEEGDYNYHLFRLRRSRTCRLLKTGYGGLAKLKGEFVWHDHAGEDELFFIVKGELEMQYETGSVTLSEGAVHVVPKGVRHNPVAAEECWVMLVEPVETKHTGDIIADKTRSIEEQLGQTGRA